jgi:hypothetical protein
MSINFQLTEEQKEKLNKISKLISGEGRWWFSPSFTHPKCLICNEKFKSSHTTLCIANLHLIDEEIDDWIKNHAEKHLADYDKYSELETFI